MNIVYFLILSSKKDFSVDEYPYSFDLENNIIVTNVITNRESIEIIVYTCVYYGIQANPL